MPFPPTFDRAFDETFPPDTQLANLLGQDIRNLKTDLRERFALQAGTLANRPANMDAAFGGVGYGILYFAIDTNQVFQWNGATWVDVSTVIAPKDFDNYAPVGFIAAPPSGIRINTIPAGAIQSANPIGSYIEIEVSLNISAFTGPNPVYTLSVNGFTIWTGALVPTGNWSLRGLIALSGSTVPRSTVTLIGAGSATLQRTVGGLGTTDGSAPVTVSDAFSASTTITATSDFMHIRVRK